MMLYENTNQFLGICKEDLNSKNKITVFFVLIQEGKSDYHNTSKDASKVTKGITKEGETKFSKDAGIT